MSHFTVLVAADDEKDLKAKLQPYHEYECTGIKDEYVQFSVDEQTECERDFLENQSKFNCKTFAQYMQDWHGYELHLGKWGRWTNPNKKWDWWVIGGRWGGLLKTKTGDRVDSAIVSEVDWEAMRNSHLADKKAEYEAFHKAKNLPEKEARKVLFDAGLYLMSKSELDVLESETVEEYLQKVGIEPLTFAWIGVDGVWHEKARMGWFAMTSDHNENAGSEFWAFVENLPANQKVYVVDCHI